MEAPSSHVTASFSDCDDSVSMEDAAPDADVEALRRLSDNLAAAFRSPDDFAFLADALVAVPGAPDLRVHRCVLSARSPFLRALFKRRAAAAAATGSSGGARRLPPRRLLHGAGPLRRIHLPGRRARQPLPGPPLPLPFSSMMLSWFQTFIVLAGNAYLRARLLRKQVLMPSFLSASEDVCCMRQNGLRSPYCFC